MSDKDEKKINTYWVRLVLFWIIWAVILGVILFLLFRELRQPQVVLTPEAPITRINNQKIEEVEDKLQGR